MPRFQFTLAPHIPVLAWCSRLEHGSETIHVEHGAWVEVRPTFFFEGAWGGSFEDGGFDRCDAVLGSGGKTSGQCVTFAGPSHALERLHTIRVGDRLFVSNSLAYLLAASNQELDPAYAFYESDCMTIVKGYHRAKRTLRTVSGASVTLHYCGQISVSPELELERREHQVLPRFHSYDQYVHYARGLLLRVRSNASSSERRIRYRPVTTISSGYDSAACAVFARELGCTTALSFVGARDYAIIPPSDNDDSGRPIARCLRMEVREFDREEYRSSSSLPEAEFLASGNGGDDVVMWALGPELRGAMLLTGFRGDVVWDAGVAPTEATLHHGSKDPSGASLVEFRLRTGFVHVPLPCLALPRHADLYNISRSAEMAPWRLGNDYDRPIARRLVESAGVPRELFGQEKRAITQPFWMIGDNLPLYSSTSRDDLLAYVRTWRSGKGNRVRRLFGEILLRFVWRFNYYFRGRITLRLPQSYRLLLSETPLRVHWAIDRIKQRYRPRIES